MDRVQDYALVLRRKNFGEADVLVTLLAKEHGKIRVVAKGARKVSSRLVGHIEPFSIINGMITLKPSLPILSQVTLEHSTAGLAEDGLLLQQLSLLAEIVDKGLEEGAVSEPVYHLIVDGSLRMRAHPELALFIGLIIRLLGLLGYAPQVSHCVRCGERLASTDSFGWSHSAGGIVVNQCISASDGAILRSGENGIKALRFLQQQPLSQMERLRLPRAVVDELQDTITCYARYVLETPLMAATTSYSDESSS